MHKQTKRKNWNAFQLECMYTSLYSAARDQRSPWNSATGFHVQNDHTCNRHAQKVMTTECFGLRKTWNMENTIETVCTQWHAYWFLKDPLGWRFFNDWAKFLKRCGSHNLGINRKRSNPCKNVGTLSLVPSHGFQLDIFLWRLLTPLFENKRIFIPVSL